ncbi:MULTISPECIES: rhamnogalacturonan acetylesterase [unclassified Leeuwenhoekiella]|uniref:rhamnogalacturonan acetylesterase n=1 Tax=unclassified Leeuwenhoekiella TaxID=2615029 RepID=UPI000C45F2F4|nr:MULTISPECIES: rhamnogalacturonan acetylesterase [unclassified Leeuwenhoekiella]MAW97046.1 rhamnogalacturonan acetylesterase [Leeuwenhoekiella sp.]MBA80673.1 rhamnogalacturonan acetylesterase [Leeuwenhoekiella sp.]|tara:strand:+ start:1996 stop:3276 length:1281 start_codon:yes stop_codon:yes gene_type:complete
MKALVLGLLFSFFSLQAQNTIDYRFVFGTENSPEQATTVSPQLPYQSDTGYGFDFGTAYRVTQHNNGFKANAPVYFSVDVPEGIYNITIILSGKDTEMTVKAESKRLLAFREKLDTPDKRVKTFTVAVYNPEISENYKVGLKDRELGKLDWDRKLTLEFLGNSTIHEIHITPVTDTRTLFLAGDSTVTNQDVEPWASWGQFITAYLDENIAVSNQASSGASLASFKGSRIDKILSQLKPEDFVIIEFGHNDEKIKGEGNGAWGLYTDLLTDFIQRIREKKGVPILITPTQRRAFEGAKLKETHGDFPDAMRKVAKEEDVLLVDLTKMTTQMYKAWGPEESRKAFVQYPANTFPGQSSKLEDNTHFSNFGANEIALAVANAIRNSDSELKKYIATETPNNDPSQPNPADSYTIPFSSRFQIEKPDGN